MRSTVIQAPPVNLAISTTATVMPVAIAPTALIAILFRAFAPPFFHGPPCPYLGQCKSQKRADCVQRNQGSVTPRKMMSNRAVRNASAYTPGVKTASSRAVRARGKNPLVAMARDRRGKSANAVFADKDKTV